MKLLRYKKIKNNVYKNKTSKNHVYKNIQAIT